MELKKPSEYCNVLYGRVMVLASRLPFADLDVLQHRHGCFESLVSGTVVVGGKTIDLITDPPLTVCLPWPPCTSTPEVNLCSTDDHLTAMMMVVAFVQSPDLDEAMI